ncbi:hypothetical protein SLS58_000984 [Diplodia intermedia]|uniref:DUF7730 domain-containing protein n=1 Tax=Diplodia intermedia TaxID=856260 RepID=A0ABR3U4G2_9PEZI
MASKRQRYLYRPLYHGLVRPLGYCLLTPLVIVLLAADLWCTCCCSRTLESRSWPLAREWSALCTRLEEEYTPPPLLPVSDHDADKKEARAQHQSPFFAKLPPELRMRIYHEVLGGNVLHLLLKPRRIGHVVCTRDHSAVRAPRDPDRRCIAAYTAPRELQQQRELLAVSPVPLPTDYCPGFALSEHFYFLYSTHHRAHDDHPPYPPCPNIFYRQHYRCPLHEPQSMSHINPPSSLPATSSVTGLLAILLTCRRVYREAAPTLYQANVFDANHPQTLALFATTIPPHRLASIRELQLRWTWRLRHRPNSYQPTYWWAQLWKPDGPVARMTGLRAVYLSLELEGYRPGVTPGMFVEQARRAANLTREEEGFLAPAAGALRGRRDALRRVEVAVENGRDDGSVRESSHPPSPARVWLEGVAARRGRGAGDEEGEGDERREDPPAS